MKNFRPIATKCCGTCRELIQDDMSGHYYCRLEEGAKYPTIDFDPQEGEQWQYTCDNWSGCDETMKLRIWYVKNIPRKSKHFPIDSVEQAVTKINEMIHRDLEDPLVTDNAFGLEIYKEGDWTEYYDEKGKDIFEIIEKNEKDNREKNKK